MLLKDNKNHLISSEQLADWVPGSVLADSTGKGWKGIGQRTYRYVGQDVQIPPMDSFMLVQYVSGTSPMDREFDGRWTRTECRPGHFSLLSRSMASHWNWTKGLTVSHVYLDNDLMRRIAQDMTGKVVNQVCLHDVLQGVDPAVSALLHEITDEAKAECASGSLYAEALSIQLAVHLLRKYSSCDHPAPGVRSGL
jgi:AraC family transcriptional regulator